MKSSHFGTQSDRNHANKEHILEAKKRVFRYCIFARNSADGTTGRAEEPGNDFLVTLDALTMRSNLAIASIFMHELGHTLGLNHGGSQTNDINYKPNYVSVMNYALMNPNLHGYNFLDYCSHRLPTLNEKHLNERNGIAAPSGAYSSLSMPYGYRDSAGNRDVKFASLDGSPVDWDQDGVIESDISADLNHLPSSYPGAYNSPSLGQPLEGHDDWANLIYNFRKTLAYRSGIHGSVDDTEITQEILDWMEENMEVPSRFPWAMFLPAMTKDKQ